ncbi:MAG: histone H1 [bacterium]
MKTLAEQIAITYATFTENADLQLNNNNKSAGLRARKASLEIAKRCGEFRRISLFNSKV